MSLMIMVHCTEITTYVHKDGVPGALHVRLSGDGSITSHDITIFLDDQRLAEMIVEAINSAVMVRGVEIADMQAVLEVAQ